jgi:hypothetical protein
MAPGISQRLENMTTRSNALRRGGKIPLSTLLPACLVPRANQPVEGINGVPRQLSR